MKTTIFLLLLFINSLGISATMYSGGTYVPYFNKTQINNSGGKQFFELIPYFGAGTQIQLSGPHFFVPEVGLAYYLNNPKKTHRNMLFLHYNFSYAITDTSILRYGLTNHWYMIRGDGGNVTLKNGSGTTDFVAPSKNRTSYFTTLNLGYEGFVSSDMSLRFDLNFMSFAKWEHEAMNYILTFNFYR